MDCQRGSYHVCLRFYTLIGAAKKRAKYNKFNGVGYKEKSNSAAWLESFMTIQFPDLSYTLHIDETSGDIEILL